MTTLNSCEGDMVFDKFHFSNPKKKQCFTNLLPEGLFFKLFESVFQILMTFSSKSDSCEEEFQKSNFIHAKGI
jgi:hypothetical protein